MFTKEMSDNKDLPSVAPTVVFQSQETKKKMSPTKKYAIIGVFSVLLLGLLLAGILVGMHIFTQAQKDLLEYTLTLDKNRRQDVTSDTTNNIVKYHVQDSEREAWIVDDFNTDIKVTKIITKGDTVCYLAPLNRSTALEPSKVTKPSSDFDASKMPHDTVIYQTSGEPVSDISFLNKEARNICKGVSTYWIYPSCGNSANPAPNITSPIHKRAAPYYVESYVVNGGITYPCINGCCKTVCACRISYTWVFVGGRMYCKWVYWRCCPGTSYCYFANYCQATPGLVCTAGTC